MCLGLSMYYLHEAAGMLDRAAETVSGAKAD